MLVPLFYLALDRCSFHIQKTSHPFLQFNKNWLQENVYIGSNVRGGCFLVDN